MSQDELLVLDKPHQIEMYKLLALKHALRLEIKGLTRHGASVYSIVKREFGFVGGKQRVLEQLEEHIFKKQQKELDLANKD
jgi:hypothetical protein